MTSWQAVGSGYDISYFYDALNRPSSQYIMQSGSSSNPLARTYSYLAGANGGTTALVSGVTYSGHSSAAYTYSYDVRGNITAVYKDGTLQVSYVYDDLNQLTRENNVTANKTWVYAYDRRGNILSRKTYAYTTGTLGTVQDTDTYEYFDQSSTSAWGDVLLRYDGIDYNIYDAIGNPTRYMNVNESGAIYTFSWQNGRQLASGTKGETAFAYTYNADGLRTRKVVDGVTTEYYWAGSQLAMMVVNPGTSSEKVLKFYYDVAGSPFCFDLDGEIYFYITNLQGDIVAIANQYGEGARYEYDAWGKILSVSCATGSFEAAAYANPLRYRGYIYDKETGFYYVSSRYYDPIIGRWISSGEHLNDGVCRKNQYIYGKNQVVSVSCEAVTSGGDSISVTVFENFEAKNLNVCIVRSYGIIYKTQENNSVKKLIGGQFRLTMEEFKGYENSWFRVGKKTTSTISFGREGTLTYFLDGAFNSWLSDINMTAGGCLSIYNYSHESSVSLDGHSWSITYKGRGISGYFDLDNASGIGIIIDTETDGRVTKTTAYVLEVSMSDIAYTAFAVIGLVSLGVIYSLLNSMPPTPSLIPTMGGSTFLT